ncbi:hypothetical protein [Kitasatospora sp. NPDC097643]|uniref:hypothetical protein n=1 Tax=Kitasatospora sp. NPDC097643 TaxID=3157230 RepID=UPI0033278A55
MRNIRRTVAMTAATVALVGGTTLALGGTAQAAPASCSYPAAQLFSQVGGPQFACTGYYSGSWWGTWKVASGAHWATFLCNDSGNWYNIALSPYQVGYTRNANDECTQVAVTS